MPDNIFAADVRRKAPSRADTTSHSEDGLPPSTDAGDFEGSDDDEEVNDKVSSVGILDVSLELLNRCIAASVAQDVVHKVRRVAL